jgi:feruloyl esterase
MFRLSRGFLLLVVASSPLLFAADCANLKTLQLADTTIAIAESVTSGALAGSDIGAPLHDLPAFCRVAGEIRPTPDSRIRFEVWLPAEGWNGRVLGTGNGGFAGSISYQQLAGYLKRGFAVTGTDAGHEAESTDASWAYGHPEKVKDFGWRAIHLTAERAKQILNAYYGKPADKSYFDACSDGGREALMEAQRFPDDYDGILAGAPAYAWSTLLGAGARALQQLTGDPNAYITDGKLNAIQRASLTACDALDGVKDNVIGEPAKCRFDPQVLLCKGEDSPECLTQSQIDSLKFLYAGFKDEHGALIFPGTSMGDETSWKQWVVGEDPTASLSSRFAQNYFRYMVTGDPRFNVLTARPDDLLRKSIEKSAADLDATNPDLSKFAERGGKLILYHGLNDPAIAPGYTVSYFRNVQEKMGAEKSASFVRLYMIPGMEHCTNGPGASAFGQLGIPTSGPQFGLFDSLENWVEKGSPLDNVTATKYDAGPNGMPKPKFTRPLCAYPKVARYTGSGDTNDASNFACVAP